MKSRSAEKIKLTSIDELLGVVNEESAMEIDISKIHAFKDHPFKVLDDEKMTDLFYFEEMNQEKIADYLGIRQQSVCEMLQRALSVMKKHADAEKK